VSYPGALLQWAFGGVTYDDGTPAANGYLKPYIAGTDFNDPKLLYADAELTTPLPTTVPLNAAGKVTAFMESGGYDIQVFDSADNLLVSVEGQEDIGLTFLTTLGVLWSSGSKSVTSGYTILPEDQLVTVDTSGGASTIYLPAAADYQGGPLFVQNLNSNTIALTPDGSETINFVAAAATIPAGSVSQQLPLMQLISDGISNWTVISTAYF
jgi:hypothetical protein